MPARRRGGGRRRLLGLLLGALAAVPAPARAQRPVTLEAAVAAAEASAPTVLAARADSAAARAEVGLARAYPNPSLNLDYSRSTPRNHVVLEQPIDYPWLRSARIRAAETAAGATHLLAGAERAAVRYQVEVAYAQAAGAAEISRLSRQTVEGGEELLRSVRAREAAGDVSELDVALAQVTLGELRSAALADSLADVEATLALQTLMGLPPDSVVIQAADSLAALPATAPPAAPVLRVAAAERQLAAQQAQLLLARRDRFPALSIRAGFEQGDPSGGETGVLPTVGVGIPIPLFSHGGAEVARARAGAARAQAELTGLQRESRAALAAAERERKAARMRLDLDRSTVASAQRVASLARTAYGEGAYPLASVLEAQRNARDALRKYVEDLVGSRRAEAAYRLAATAGGATP
ncbi:MAG TPA: TolC family protein [Longimicrobiaceae bacterium]|nr:TolC family protein [Longimicrobiaceae bacterium]